MNLTHLECFLAVADELHFGRAAERLHRSPATVSEAIGALERSLGVRLFSRTSRRVELTAPGRTFLSEVKKPYQHLVAAHENARSRGEQRGRLHIAHTPELGSLLLPGLHAAAARDLDSPRWKPVCMHTQQQRRAVEAGTVDIGLCWSVTAAPPLRTVVLRELPLVAVLCGDDPLAAQPVVRLEQLRSRTVLMIPRRDNAFLASQTLLAFARAGLDPENIQEVPRYDELVLQVAARGLVGLHAASIAGTNRVATMTFRPVEPTMTVSVCALLRDDHQDAAVDSVLAALRDIANDIDLPRAGTPG